MKKSIVAAGVLALLASTGAHAADVVTYQEPVVAPAPVAVNWSGFYAGGTIGGSWGEADTKLKSTRKKNTVIKKKVKPETFMGGLYAGYNFETASNLVWGIETDFLWNSDGDSASKGYNLGGADNTAQNAYGASVKQKWNGATRLRLGYAMGQEKRFLPYIAGGVSYAKFDVASRTAQINGKAPENKSGFSGSETHVGWNIGAGIDYVPPIMNDHLVLRAEYRYTDLGDKNYNKANYAGTDISGNSYPLKQNMDYSQNDFRVGVAYKF